MTDHTPGPWIAKDDDLEACEVGIADRSEWLGVANAYGDTPEEAHANAHLIAAAPDMYDALKAIKARIDGEYDNPALAKQGDLHYHTDADVLRFAEEAITKAEGRE